MYVKQRSPGLGLQGPQVALVTIRGPAALLALVDRRASDKSLGKQSLGLSFLFFHSLPPLGSSSVTSLLLSLSPLGAEASVGGRPSEWPPSPELLPG